MKELDINEVLKYFYEISRIPRMSGKEEKIADYIENFATERNLKYIRDIYNNIIIFKDSTKWNNSEESIMLQCHLDMVCEKEENSNQTGVIMIYGISKFISKLEKQQEMADLVKLIKEYEKISLVIVDDASKIKQFSFETWFNGFFSVNDGIWIGRGIADQNFFISFSRKDLNI